MVEQVWKEPAIYRILVTLPQNPLRILNSYVIKTPDRSLLIDTGFNRDECREALWAGIQELELDLSKAVLFLTHLHSDHAGLVWDFVDREVPVYISRVDHAYSSASLSGRIWPLQEAQYRREGYPEEELALQGSNNQARLYSPRRIYPATLVEDGDVLSIGGVEVQCISTPGHTPGHMALYLPKEQILFSGDHILFDITPNIGIWQDVPHSLADYLDSLERIRSLPVKLTLPGHRGWEGDIYQRIDFLLAHHDKRLEEILQAVRAAPGSTAFQLAGHITWSARGLPWEQFPPHQKWFAMSETLSHLYYLLQHNRLRREEDGDVLRYFI